ncbi:hypothetical protein FSP39_017328 [Pinctada imbricata]|uniref:Cytochrome P450 n=1 Tax=Pinctada imbricata TaxID=66713 RepID=A0AA88Y0X6_PINIB|nr:hypothetical protein FSP39_017328 [Pinctada imbricata]
MGNPELNCTIQPMRQEVKTTSFSFHLPINPLTAVLIVITTALLVRYLRNLYSIFERINLPGPKPKWVFGNIQDFRDKNPLDVFAAWRKKYGDVYGFFEGFRPSVVINDPEMARQVLVTHFDNFHVRPIYNPFVYYPDDRSLLNIFGEDWRQQRHVVSSVFNSASFKYMISGMEHVSERLLQKVSEIESESPEGFNISLLLDRYVVDSFAYSGFDYDVDSLNNENAPLYRYMVEFNNSASAENPATGLCRVYASLIPLLKVFDTKHREAAHVHLQEMRKLITTQKEKITSDPDSNCRKNLLGQLMLHEYPVKDESGKVVCKRSLTDEEVIAHMNSLIGGGISTAGATLSFVLHQLAMNPHVEQQAYEYVLEHCGTDGLPDTSTLKRLDFLEQIIKETLRLLPCAPGVARTCTNDCEINNVQFKEGMLIRIMGCTLYSDPDIFPNPDVFDPKRFEASECEKRHTSLFLPFGQGPRVCPGVKFAFLQLKVSLIKILQQFSIQKCSRTMDPLPTTLKPILCPMEGVFVKLVRRK